MPKNTNKRMQPDFGGLALASAADEKRYKAFTDPNISRHRENGKNQLQ